MLTSSDHPTDIKKAARLNANSYVTKPQVLERYEDAVGQIVRYWSGVDSFVTSA